MILLLLLQLNILGVYETAGEDVTEPALEED